MKNDSLVSCVIPSYKRTDTLVRAVESVLNQTYKNVEVLVVDDNIPGDEYSQALREIINQYKDEPRVRLITQEKHINGAEARNAGVRASSADFIAFLDDDDEWLSNKIEIQMSIMDKDPKLGGVAGGVTRWKGNREISNLSDSKVLEDNLLLNVLIRKIRFATSSFLCRKSAFEAIGGFDNTLVRSQDLQLFADFLVHYRIFPLTNIRTTKMYVESNINRLNCEELIKNKKDFFESISDVMALFPKYTRNRIKSAHFYEIAFVAFKERKFIIGLEYLLKGLISLRSIIDLIERYKKRIYLIKH